MTGQLKCPCGKRHGVSHPFTDVGATSAAPGYLRVPVSGEWTVGWQTTAWQTTAWQTTAPPGLEPRPVALIHSPMMDNHDWEVPLDSEDAVRRFTQRRLAADRAMARARQRG